MDNDYNFYDDDEFPIISSKTTNQNYIDIIDGKCELIEKNFTLNSTSISAPLSGISTESGSIDTIHSTFSDNNLNTSRSDEIISRSQERIKRKRNENYISKKFNFDISSNKNVSDERKETLYECFKRIENDTKSIIFKNKKNKVIIDVSDDDTDDDNLNKNNKNDKNDEKIDTYIQKLNPLLSYDNNVNIEYLFHDDFEKINELNLKCILGEKIERMTNEELICIDLF